MWANMTAVFWLSVGACLMDIFVGYGACVETLPEQCASTRALPEAPSLSSPPNWDADGDLPRLEACRKANCAAASSSFNPQVDVAFFLYTRFNPSLGQRLRISTSSFQFSHFVKWRPTKVLVHGWISSLQSPNYHLMTVIRQVYLSQRDCNVIFVDWSRRAIGSYLQAAGNTVATADTLAKFLEVLIQVGADPKSIHIVGHSLGAQVAGIAGFSVRERMAVGRVTGLDPAGWMFELPRLQPAPLRISPFAADFVDVIHTTGGLAGLGVGSSLALGHADFYVNRGEAPQPGCRQTENAVACSHTRVLLYFIESIRNPNSFVATRCRGWAMFEDGACRDELQAPMGDPAHDGLRGLFFLRTNSNKPFGLGNIGRNSQRNVFAENFTNFSSFYTKNQLVAEIDEI